MRTILLLLLSAFPASALAQALSAPPSPGYNSHSFVYLNQVLSDTAPIGLITMSAFNAQGLPKYYALAVTGTATGYTVRLEGSLTKLADSSQWQLVASTTTSTGVTFISSAEPLLFLRLRATGLSGSTSVTATAIGAW